MPTPAGNIYSVLYTAADGESEATVGMDANTEEGRQAIFDAVGVGLDAESPTIEVVKSA